MLSKDIQDNKQLSENGVKHITKNINMEKDGFTILTHCNTGSLATAGYGTALGRLNYMNIT